MTTHAEPGLVPVEPEDSSGHIAVIGMAGRFPGSSDLSRLWQALVTGQELLTRSEEDPTAAYGVVPDADAFDAEFFGYSPNEALLLDPQHRVLLECAWEALEHAGYDPSGLQVPVGVYAGCGDTGHLDQLRAHAGQLPETSELQFRLASSSDFLTSRISYKLGLKGPAVTVQAACATGLVAVHMAGQALLGGECDLALAGGVTMHVPAPAGAAYEADITASDGIVRTFDAQASGTIGSDGAGIVVLKRLPDALVDGDHVLAVITGSAVTNDGGGRVGFTAPTVSGVAAAASAALAVADVDPESVSFVEAHGTGTPVGDPIEVRGLTRAYLAGRQPGSDRTLLGSVKPATGHTDAAAGVLGLIKVVMSLQNQAIPPTLHYRTPNPELQLETSPFRISAAVEPWPRSDRPRRAGVNSMGLGGTNVHAIVQESPEPTWHARPGTPAWSHQLLPFSARTPAALAELAGRITGWLAGRADAELADAAWTLQTGRAEFRHRGFVVAAGGPDARPADDQSGRPVRSTRPAPDNPPDVVFLFPGQGGQHLGMGRELYRDHAGFRADIDACAELAADRLALDLRTVLFADEADPAQAAQAGAQLARMQVAQPVVFAVQYALARLWQSWGIQPAAVAGHSLGAYAAATLAGVLSLPDAMRLVLTRSAILDRAPEGAMLAVPVPVERVAGWLGRDLSLAAVNGPEQCVVAGARSAIATLAQRCQADGIDARILRISAAAHSHLIEPFCAEYEKAVAEVTLNPPRLRWLSDQTGAPVTAAEATDPSYWSSHLRNTVNFNAVLDTVTRDSAAVLLEVGPGRTLSSLARQHPGHTEHQPVIASLPSAHDEVAEPAFLLTAAGQLWQSGVAIDWAAVHEGESRRRVATLPTYPFQRRHFRLDGASSEAMLPQAPADPAAGNPADPTAGNPADPAAGNPAIRWESATQAAVAAAFTAILGAEPEHAEADFFELGGDSLLASRVAAWLRRELQVEIGVRAVFGSPTVAGLGAYLDDKLARS